MQYNIANIPISIKDRRLNIPLEWEKFKIEGGSVDASVLEIFLAKDYQVIHGIECYDLPITINKINKFEKGIMGIDDTWSKMAMIFLSNEKYIDIFFIQAFYTHAVQRHMIQFHSSLIDYQGHGLMFLGPSGIGKTTQAELWNKYRDALIINGDIVFVQETEEVFFGWGTPWHGSSPYCENTNVPVEALIILKQAPENSIRKLEGFEKVTAVSNSVFYPRWVENGMELCLETLDHLLSKIPVYELSCRPDEEAVELTEKTIFGREN